jgi:aspartate/methionine/tyrosine aminotransferase
MVRLAKRMPDMKKGFYGFFEPPPPDVVRFTVGEPDFDTPRPIVDEAIKALDNGETSPIYGRPWPTSCGPRTGYRPRPRTWS